jgi:hypothetical protein
MTEECCKRNFIDSLKDSARRVLENPRIVPREVRSQRLQLCHNCDHYLQQTDQCEICQCIMGIKSSFENMRCPLDRWEEFTSESPGVEL